MGVLNGNADEGMDLTLQNTSVATRQIASLNVIYP